MKSSAWMGLFILYFDFNKNYTVIGKEYVKTHIKGIYHGKRFNQSKNAG